MNLLNFLHSLNIQLYQSTLSLVLCLSTSSTNSVFALLFSNVRYHKTDLLCCEHKLRLSLQKKMSKELHIQKSWITFFSPRSRYSYLACIICLYYYVIYHIILIWGVFWWVIHSAQQREPFLQLSDPADAVIELTSEDDFAAKLDALA